MGRYVVPLPSHPDRRRVPNSHVGAYRGLGAVGSGCVMGTATVGGDFQVDPSDPSVLLLTPDQAPNAVYRLTDYPYPTHPDKRGRAVRDVKSYLGTSGRMHATGALFTDDTVYFTGWGKVQVNEFWDAQRLAEERGGVFHRGATVYLNLPGLFDVYTGGAPVCLGQGLPGSGGGNGTTNGASEDPPDPWTGEQVATISYDGASRVVTVYGADDVTYTVDPDNTPPAIMEELQTTAPQGERLVMRGAWDPAEGFVDVMDWYIEKLGPGEKKYGVTPEGDLVPQGPDVPSTDWPGGLPVTDPRHPDYVPPEDGASAPAKAGAGPLLAFALLGGGLVMLSRDREENP